MSSRYLKRNKVEKHRYWHEWQVGEYENHWFIRDYDTGYLSITKFDKGEMDPVTKYVFEKTTYKPLTQGYRLNQSFNNTCDATPIYFTSLEEAKEAVQNRWKFLRVHTQEIIDDEKTGGTKRKELVKKNRELAKNGGLKLYAE